MDVFSLVKFSVIHMELKHSFELSYIQLGNLVMIVFLLESYFRQNTTSVIIISFYNKMLMK